MSKYRILNGIIYTAGWLFCVICGANQHPLPPILFTAVAVLGQLVFLKKIDLPTYYLDSVLVGFGASFGLLMEIGIINLGLVKYATDNTLSGSLPPGWVWCLYFLFSLTYNHSLKFLNMNKVFPILFGAIGGPLSYYAGNRLGAVSFPYAYSLIVLGAFWAGYLSFMVYINLRLQKIVRHVFDEEHLGKPLTVFFDSVCPICSRELEYLKKREQTGNINYYEITSKSDFEKTIKEVDFLSAMKEINAVDYKGEVLKGIDVFAELYPRVGLPVISILIQAPILRSITSFGYKIWAKYRLKNRCNIQPLE